LLWSVPGSLPRAMSDNEKDAVDGEADDNVPEIAEETGEPTHEPFSLKIWSNTKGQQAVNGLRHNDHLRYRQYCTRRLRRLRCAVRWKNPKGRGKQVPFPSDFQDKRFIEFPLCCSERAWSYGVQLKADNATAGTWQPRWRLHSIRRFAKAMKWAEFLESVCKRHADQRTQREAEAYTAFMAGTLLMEKEEWEEALAKFQRCRKVCDTLALASEEDEKKIFKEHSASLGPGIRECKYHLGQDQDEDEETPMQGARKELAGLKYRNHGLADPPEKIKVQLLKCLQLANAVKVGGVEESGAVIEKYGELSAEFGDALKDIHTDMINAGDSKDGSDEPSLEEHEWKLLEAFARELSICMNVERNLVLLWNHLTKLDGLQEMGSTEARRTCRPEEGMRYCDLLKEDLESLLELPETSDSIKESLSAYIEVALNCRCFFLALCHSLTGKLLESAALLDMLGSRSQKLGEALDEPLGRLHPFFDRVVEGMPTRVAAWRCRALASLCGKGPKSKEQESDQDGASFPPRVRDIPCKPLLFDLAFPCIEAPDVEELLPKSKAQGGAGGDQKGLLGKVAGGIGSRLGSLWGRK